MTRDIQHNDAQSKWTSYTQPKAVTQSAVVQLKTSWKADGQAISAAKEVAHLEGACQHPAPVITDASSPTHGSNDHVTAYISTFARPSKLSA